VKSAYTVKLTKFEDTKKVALIKEIKTLVEGMNLVQVCHQIFIHIKLKLQY
jgi:large subunit ribosomal protein L7/L12